MKTKSTDAFAVLIVLLITGGETFKWLSIRKYVICIVLKPFKTKRNLF